MRLAFKPTQTLLILCSLLLLVLFLFSPIAPAPETWIPFCNPAVLNKASPAQAVDGATPPLIMNSPNSFDGNTAMREVKLSDSDTRTSANRDNALTPKHWMLSVPMLC